MRVALLCATSARTGVETHLRMLADGIAGAGGTPVLVCAAPGPLVDDFRARGFAVRLAAPAGRFGGVSLSGLAGALADADLVHAHGPRAIFWSARVRGRRPRQPFIATVHQFHASGLDRALHRRVFAALEAWSIRRHDRVIVVSPDVRERVLRAGAAVDARTIVIPHSVPLLAERALTRRAAEPVPARAIVAARFDPVKGLDLLLEAWGRLRRDGVALPLTILGDGPERAALVASAAALGVADLVRFEGIVSDVPARFEGAALYVAPSRDETLGGALLEAMAIGLPAVATAVPGHRFLLADVAPECLVPVEDPAALAGGVRRLLALSPGERLALGARLQDRAYAAFAPARIVAAVLDVYRGALAAGPEA